MVSSFKNSKRCAMSSECSIVHRLVTELQEHSFPWQESQIPSNGIYIVFEKGEHGHGGNRITRIGTHTGDNQLRSRLKQHFLEANKDRSIFRKNIGRAMLNQQGDPFLEDWEIDLTTKKARERYSSLMDHEYQKRIETEVSRHIRANFSFCAFEVQEKKERLALEAKLISTVSKCEACKPSQSWLGKSSPVEKISESGLWLINGLYKTPFDVSGIEHLSRFIAPPMR